VLEMGINYAAEYMKMFGKKPTGARLIQPPANRNISPFFGGQTQGLGGDASYYGPGGAGDGSGRGQAQQKSPNNAFRRAMGMEEVKEDPKTTPVTTDLNNSPDRPSQPPSNSTPAPEPPGPMTMAEVDAMYGRLSLGSYSGRNATQAESNASVQLPESITSFYLSEEDKKNYKFTLPDEVDAGVNIQGMDKYNTSFQLEKPVPEFNLEASKNLPDSFGLTGGMSGQSGLSKALSEVKPVESTKTPREKASEAFLRAEDPLLGLRARDRELGLVYAEGKYYTQNPNMGQEGENDFSLLKDEEAKQVIRGEAGAQELLKKRLAALQDETPANAAEIQAPIDVSKIASEVEGNAYPIQQGEPKLTGNKLEDAFNSGYEGNVPLAIQMYKDLNKDFNVLSKEDRERIFNKPGIYGR